MGSASAIQAGDAYVSIGLDTTPLDNALPRIEAKIAAMFQGAIPTAKPAAQIAASLNQIAGASGVPITVAPRPVSGNRTAPQEKAAPGPVQTPIVAAVAQAVTAPVVPTVAPAASGGSPAAPTGPSRAPTAPSSGPIAAAAVAQAQFNATIASGAQPLARQNGLLKSLNGILGEVTGSFGPMIKASIAAYAGFKGLQFIRQSVTAAGEAEIANVKLASALANAGDATQETYSRTLEFAESLSKQTTMSKDAVIATAAVGASLGKLSGKQLEDATQAAIGWATIMGTDATDAMKNIVFAMENGRSSLDRYLPGLDLYTTKQDRLNFIMKTGAPGFALMQAEMNTSAGAIKSAAKAWDEVSEAMGKGFVQGSALVELLGIMSDEADASGSAWETFGEILGTAFGTIVALVQTIFVSVKVYIMLVVSAIAYVLSAIAKVIGLIPGLGDSVGKFGEASQEFAQGLKIEAGQDLQDIGKTWKALVTNKEDQSKVKNKRPDVGAGMPTDRGEKAQVQLATASAAAFAGLAGIAPGAMSAPAIAGVTAANLSAPTIEAKPATVEMQERQSTILTRIEINTRSKGGLP